MSNGSNPTPEPSKWEKRWKRIEVISAIILTCAGVVIAFLLGYAQKKISDIGSQTAQRQALANLIIALGNEQATIRQQAAIALAQFGKDAVPTLSLALEDSNKDVQLSAVKAFVHIYQLKESQDMIDQISRMVKEGENENAIEGAILVLYRIKPDDVSTIISNAKDISFEYAINTLKKENKLEDLYELMVHKELSERNRIYVIGTIDKFSSQVEKSFVDKLISAFKSNVMTEDAKLATITVLANIMKQRSQNNEIFSTLKSTFIDLLLSDNNRIRALALNTLKPFHRDQIINAKIKVIATETDPKYSVSSEIAKQILSLKDK